MGKNCFRRSTSARRRLKTPTQAPPSAVASPMIAADQSLVVATKPKKKGGARLWMRLDTVGISELIECEKGTIIKRASLPPRDLRILGPVFSHSSNILGLNTLGISELIECKKGTIIKRASLPSRDLRILGPVFSHSSNILAREKAMVVNLEFIKAIVTAEEVLLLDPLRQEVLPFVDQLRQQLINKSPPKVQGRDTQTQDNNDRRRSNSGQWLPVPEVVEGLQSELPFEFQVLEIALEVVCTYLDSSVADLERDAYPVLDELARNVSTKNLEHVRSLKSNLTRLLARVQKVRDEIEHLLDDNEDMAQLYLTRKWIQNQQYEALVGGADSIVSAGSRLCRLSSKRSASIISSNYLDDHDVEDLEMLLEAYFMQLDGTRNKILSVREYIDDTEDYVNIQLDNQRNELIQLQLTLTIASFAIAVETLIAGSFGMNIPCQLYETDGIFNIFVASITAVCILLFLLVLGYARWKKLLGS